MEYSNTLLVVADTGTVGDDKTISSEVGRILAPTLADISRQRRLSLRQLANHHTDNQRAASR